MKYVNKADVNVLDRPAASAERVARPVGEGYDGATVRLIELLFFAYRDFVAAPDEVLSKQGFGRAHHRVLHFVNRNPGLPVAELLRVLKITKQSLARVLKDLIAAEFVEQRPGARDRRQRLLHTTVSGRDLAQKLAELQSARIRAALAGLPAETAAAAEHFLFAMIDMEDRPTVAKLVGIGGAGDGSSGRRS
jgi:DNA-binding MarR family transcriptional regulator